MTADARPEVEGRLDELLEGLLRCGPGLAHLLVSRRLSGDVYRRLAEGIPPVQLQALAVLSAGDMRMRELAHRLGLATSTVTRLVDRLEAAGLVERRAERPDRRSVLVGLSAAGRSALARIGNRARVLVRELLSGLAPHEQGELLRLLTKLAEGLVPAAPEPAPARARSR
ncbi:MAG TPA: MarR family transcriptional regulator [Gaiellaceae bacterium]|nr:MarR family transcriptional regulator [Gaiellaceae bacterium]